MPQFRRTPPAREKTEKNPREKTKGSGLFEWCSKWVRITVFFIAET